MGFLLCSCAGTTAYQSFKQAARNEISVVIDAGHGGKDPGAAYFGVQEKDINLIMAEKLRASLEKHQVRVWLTRKDDTFIPLKKRIALANNLDADLFVSLHANANPHADLSGAEVYYAKESSVGLFPHWPATVARSEIHSHSEDARFSMWDLLSHQNRSASYAYSQEACRQLRLQLDTTCKEKEARFVVLREAQVPAMLVEVGYLSHREESRKLQDPNYQDRAVQALTQSILASLKVPHETAD